MELIRNNKGSVALPAINPPWVRATLDDPDFLRDTSAAVAGPFHVVFPERFAENLDSFIRALEAAGVEGVVYYGKKANKARCFTRRCANRDGAGVDVASSAELVEALAAGVRGKDLVVTGPAKNTELLWTAARHGALIAIDALDELERTIALAQDIAGVRILLRVLPETNGASRFGLDTMELERALARCAEERERVRMEGFSFHLSGYAVAPRAQLSSELVDRCVQARARGLVADSVSIGGGFAMNYLEPGDWAEFMSGYQDEWFHARKKFAYFYPYHQTPVGADMLADILRSGLAPGYRALAEKFAKNKVRLLLEPGRALLDGCGFSVFPVQGFKERGDYGVIAVGGVSMSVSAQWFDSEYLPDPELWPETGEHEPVPACAGGSTCLETDMLMWRKVWLARRPQFGDLLVYHNTAGYQMDFTESGFHQLPLPPKIPVMLKDGRPKRLPESGVL